MARHPWSKRWDADYLADAKLNQLTPAERGVVEILWSLLRTQMDEPGVFIQCGSILDPTGVARLVKPHCSGGGARLDIVSKWVSTVLQLGLFKQREDGAWYSARIVNESQEAEKQSGYGKKGAEKRWGASDTTIRREHIATPMGSPMPDPMGRSEADEEEEAEQPGARARVDSGKTESQEPDEVSGEPAPMFCSGIEQLTGIELVPRDRERLTRACDGKTIHQVDASLERIRDAYRSGTVRSIVAFSERVILEAPPAKAEVDRAEQVHITRAKLACSTLGLDWGNYHVNVLQAVKKYPARVHTATHATFEDVRAKVIADTPPSILERFLMRIENATEGPVLAPT